MAKFQKKVINFESPANDNDTVTLTFGFQVKAIMVFGCSPADEGGTEAHGIFAFGAAVSTSTEHGVNTYQEDGSATTSFCKHSNEDTIIHQMETSSNTVKIQANITAIGTTTVTLTFTTVHSTVNDGRHYTAVGLGGDDFEAALVEYLAPANEGSESLTGAGLSGKPDCAILFSSVTETDKPGFPHFDAQFGIGFTGGPDDECCIGYAGNDIQATSETGRTQRTNRTLAIPSPPLTGYTFACETTCFTDDGMDLEFLDYDQQPITQPRYYVLYMRGVDFKTFSGNQPTSAGTLAFQSLGFTPKFAMFASFGNVATTAIVNDTRFSLAAASATNAIGCHWISDDHGETTTVAKRYFDNAEAVQARDNDGTLQAEARLNGFLSTNGGEVELEYTTADGTARQVIGCAMAEKGGLAVEKVNWTVNSHLDRKFNLRGTISGANTTWTLPVKDDSIDTVVLGPDFGDDAGTVLTPSSNTGGVVTVAGSYADGLAILGRAYTQEIELTRPFLRDEETEVIDARVTVKKLTVNHRRTGTYDMEIKTGDRTKTKTFATTDAKTVDEDGRDEVLVAQRADNVTMKLKNASARPSTFVGVEYTLESAHGVV